VEAVGRLHRRARLFTGAFVGLHCEDISGDGCHADFDYFTYEPV
jgi:beta-xylosidase